MDRPPVRVSFILVIVILFMVLALWFTGSGKKSSTMINAERMKTLQAKILEHFEAEGGAPASLSDLKLSKEESEILKDAWENPFSYEVKDGKVTIGTLGSDAKPGGQFFREDKSRSFPLTPAEAP